MTLFQKNATKLKRDVFRRTHGSGTGMQNYFEVTLQATKQRTLVDGNEYF